LPVASPLGLKVTVNWLVAPAPMVVWPAGDTDNPEPAAPMLMVMLEVELLVTFNV